MALAKENLYSTKWADLRNLRVQRKTLPKLDNRTEGEEIHVLPHWNKAKRWEDAEFNPKSGTVQIKKFVKGPALSGNPQQGVPEPSRTSITFPILNGQFDKNEAARRDKALQLR